MSLRLTVLRPVLGVLLTLLTACHGKTSQVEPACCPPKHDARASGALVGIGGPSATAVQHWQGTIHVRGSDSSSFDTDAHGRFSVALPAGTYRFTATSPAYDGGRGRCEASGRIRLRAHHTTHVQVVCQLK